MDIYSYTLSVAELPERGNAIRRDPRTRPVYPGGGRIRLGPPISKARAKEASATLLAIWATAANLRGRDNR